MLQEEKIREVKDVIEEKRRGGGMRRGTRHGTGGCWLILSGDNMDSCLRDGYLWDGPRGTLRLRPSASFQSLDRPGLP